MTSAGPISPSVRSIDPNPPPAVPPIQEPSLQDDVLSAAERLRMQVASLSLTLDVEGVLPARRERDGILSQLDDYLLPRLRRRDAPLLAVIGGSTGAGKSTLTNSLVRREVSRSGVLRPTTRSPVLVHHPYDSGAFLSQRILPRLTRVTSEAPEPVQPIDPNAPRITGLRLVPHDELAPGLAIIDAPDIDSLVETNRDLAVQLLQAADLWIFVTTAARYADAMPWQLLRQAAERGVAIAVVLDRVPQEALRDLRVHLATRLRDRGLSGAPLFVIPETETVDGFLPEPLVAPLQNWLRRVAGDPRSRAMIADRTLKGSVASLPARVKVLAVAAEAQAVGWTQLREELENVFAGIGVHLTQVLSDGSLLSGELLARWQDFIANGELVRRLDGGIVPLADRVNAAVQGEPVTNTPLDGAVTQALADTVRAAVRGAVEEVISRWRHFPFGASLLVTRGHQATVTDVEARLERAVRDWRLEVTAQVTAAVEAVTDESARVDVQTAADVIFVALLDDRPDPDPESSQSVTATVAAARRFVEGTLGAEPVGALIELGRANLINRAMELLTSEQRRLEQLLEDDVSVAGRGQALVSAVELVMAAR